MRALFALYAFAAYALFLVAFLYAIGFVGNLLVPKSIDSGAVDAPRMALLIDVILLGAFASAFFLYGIALVYGATGTTSLVAVRERLALGNLALLTVGTFMMVAAFAFKVAAVPFHMWAPDAYEGAPTPVTAFMAAAVKVAAVAAMIRVFGQFLGGEKLPYGTLGWASPMVVLAAITITVGNIAAIRQDNVKRMLAYSSISHGGVLLVGLAAMGLGSPSGQSALVYYLIAYALTTMGAFAVVSYVGSKQNERLGVDDWAGLASKHPVYVNDFPGGAGRLQVGGRGYAATIVNGTVIAEEGVNTGARPGKVLREFSRS